MYILLIIIKKTYSQLLSTRMSELETEHSYQLRQAEATQAEKLKEVHEGYCAAIEELKEKNEVNIHFYILYFIFLGIIAGKNKHLFIKATLSKKNKGTGKYRK